MMERSRFWRWAVGTSRWRIHQGSRRPRHKTAAGRCRLPAIRIWGRGSREDLSFRPHASGFRLEHRARLFDFFSYTVEDTVNELHGLWGGEFSGYLDGLIDDDGARRLGESQELCNRRAEKVSIYCSHAVDTP